MSETYRCVECSGIGDNLFEVYIYEGAPASADSEARALCEAVRFMWAAIEGSHKLRVHIYADRVVYRGGGSWLVPGLEGYKVKWAMLWRFDCALPVPQRVSDIFDDKFFDLSAAYAAYEAEHDDSSAVVASAQAEAVQDLVRAGYSAALAQRAVYSELIAWGTYWSDRDFGYTQLAYVEAGKCLDEDSDEYAAQLALCARWQAD